MNNLHTLSDIMWCQRFGLQKYVHTTYEMHVYLHTYRSPISYLYEIYIYIYTNIIHIHTSIYIYTYSYTFPGLDMRMNLCNTRNLSELRFTGTVWRLFHLCPTSWTAPVQDQVCLNGSSHSVNAMGKQRIRALGEPNDKIVHSPVTWICTARI